MVFSAQYSDGRTAAAIPVDMRLTSESLLITDKQGQVLVSWPLAEVEAPHGVPHNFFREPFILARAGKSNVSRLTLADPHTAEAVAQELAPWLKAKKRRHTGLWVKATLGIWACAALLWLGLPLFARQVAPLIPQEWELKLGEQTQRHMEAMLAKPYGGKNWAELDAEASSILNALMTRLEMAHANDADAPKLPLLPLRVRILHSDVINAFTLPGNTIVVTTAMLAEMEQLDELAAILAHERAHVRLRHTTQLLLRHTAFSYLMEVFGASASAATAQIVFSSGWSRDMEREADTLALATMRQAGIAPHGFTRFFRRLQAKEQRGAGNPTADAVAQASSTLDIVTHQLEKMLSTHPGSAERADAGEKIPPYPCTPLFGERTWKSTGLYVKKL